MPVNKIQAPFNRRIGGLMLTIRVGDLFTINNEIFIQVSEINGNQVRLSVRGDRNKFPITRGRPEDYPTLLKTKGGSNANPDEAPEAVEPEEAGE